MAEKKTWQDKLKQRLTENLTNEKKGDTTKTTGSKYIANADFSGAVAKRIANRINTWSDNHNAFLSDYENRFSGRKYNYEDAYVSDSGSYLDTVTQQSATYKQEYNDILAELDKYSGYLNQDWVKSVKESLTKNDVVSVYDQIAGIAKQDNDYWSMFNPNEEQTAAGYTSDKIYTEWQTGEKQYAADMAFDVAAGEVELEGLKQNRDAYLKERDQQEDEEWENKSWWEKLGSYLGMNQSTSTSYYNPYDKLIAEKEQQIARAKYVQGYEGYMEIKDSTDYDTSSKYVSTRTDVPMEDASYTVSYGVGAEGAPAMSTMYDKSKLFGDFLYDYINGNKDALDVAMVNDTSDLSYFLGHDQGFLKTLTEDEIGVYNSLYSEDKKNGTNRANEFLSFIEGDLNARRRMQEQAEWAKYAKESPVASSVFSTLISPLKGISYISQAVDMLNDGEMKDDAAYNRFSYIPSTIRSQVSSTIENSGKWGKVGSFAYNTGMSMADFLFTTAVSGGNQALSLGIMGSGAAADATLAAKDRGLDDGQAFALGTIAGVAEVAMEKISLGAWLEGDMTEGALRYVLKNALSEGGEEAGTSVINLLADIMIAGDKSEWYTAMQAYIDQGKSPEEAFGLVAAEQAAQIGLDALGGMLSGAAIGGGTYAGTSVASAFQYKDTAKNKQSAQKLVTEGLELNPDSKYVQKAQSKLDNGKNLTGMQVRNILAANQEKITANDMQKIQKAAEQRLTSLGQTENVSEVAEIATKWATGQDLTRAEKKLLTHSQYGSRVANELLPDNILSGDYSTEWAEEIGTKQVNSLAYNIKSIVNEMANLNNPATYKSLEERVGTESKLNVSNSGQATISKTGGAIDLKKAEVVNIVKDEKTGKIKDMTINVDGKEVKASEIDYADGDQSYLFEAVSQIENITPAAATAIIRDYDPSTEQTVGEYLNGVDEAYTYGYYGYSDADLKAGHFAPKLTGEQAKSAYLLGQTAKNINKANKTEAIKRMRTALDAETEKANAEGKEAPKAKKMTITYNDGNGKIVDFDKAGLKKLSTEQKAAPAVAKVMHEMGLGTNFELYSSKLSKTMVDKKGNPLRVRINENGEEVAAPAGIYRKSDGTVCIDLNAYNGRELTLYSMAHELTHFIQQWSDTKYQALADFLIKTYEKTDMSMHDRVLREQNRLKDIRGEEVSYDEAFDEVVANAMMKMLDDGKVMERLAELKAQDADLAHKLWNGIKKLLSKFFRAYESNPALFNDTADLMSLKAEFEQMKQMWAEALVEASENFQASLIAKEAGIEVMPVEDGVQYSYSSLAEAAGFEAVQNEDGTRSFTREGKKVSEVTVEDIENSPIGAFINFSLEMNDISKDDADRQKKMFADICTMACKTNDFAMTMQFVGSAVFTGMKANADKQYGTTYNFPSICTKTQAVIDAMSAKMMKLGRGLNTNEIVQLYDDVFASGNPVPCPECYVFSRWIGIGGLLDNIKKYQDYYGDMAIEDVAAEYLKMKAEVSKFADEQGISFGKAKGALTAKLTKEFNKLTEKIEKAQNQGEKVKPADKQRLAELEPMMNTVKGMTWLENVYFADSSLKKVNPNFRVPDSVLFDLNNGEDFATQYKEAWAFRTTQGAGYGKAITPYAEARLGEGVLVTNNTTNAIKGRAQGSLDNYFLQQMGKLDKKSRDALKRARLKQKIQAFIGGQRFQSTSDARYENASDYLLAALEMQAMGGMVQVYTKVDGAVPAFSAWGFSINQSLMPLNGGLDANDNVKDTAVGGMKPEVAFENRKKHESAGTITIGVNDDHIRAMFKQWVRDFIIPYHASGGKADTIAEFRRIQEGKEAKVEAVRSTDYSRTQSDKVLSDEVLRWQGKTDAQIQRIHEIRNARIAILTGGNPNRTVVRSNRFLSALYDKLNGGEWDGVKLAKSKVESQIFPNEFWDQTVTYDESGKITKDYLEYCEDLGFLHRFSGMIPSNGKLVPANGYDQNGNRVQLTDLAYKYDANGNKTTEVEEFFWKVLTDRRMYDNNGKYLPQKVVTLNDTTTDTVTGFAKNNQGREYDKAKAEALAKKIVNGEQYSSQETDLDSEGNELSKNQQQYFADSKVRDADGRLMVMYHGTANGGAFTVFDGDKLGNDPRTTQVGQGFYFTNVKKEAESYTKNVDIYGKVSAGRNPHLHQVYLNITSPFNIDTDTLDITKVKSVYMDGTYEWFFSEWIPFYLNKKTVNGSTLTKAEIQAMSKSDKVSMYVDYLTNFGTKEVLSNMVRAFPSAKQSELLASMKNRLGYDGIVEEFKPGQYQYVAFSSEQVKNVDNQNPTTNSDIRYSSQETDFDKDFDYSDLNWANDLGIITAKDRAIFERTINNEIFRGAEPQSANGEYIIDTGKCLMFTDGDFHNPTLTRVIVFATEYESLTADAKEMIFDEAEATGEVQASLSAIEKMFGQGFVSHYDRPNGRTYAGQNRGRKGSNRSRTAQTVRAKSLKERLAEEGKEHLLYSSQEADLDSKGKQLGEDQLEYFEKSMVRDRNGRLQVVYHGGTVEYEFDTTRGGKGATQYGPGAYFTDSEYYAKEYTWYRGGDVKDYYLNIERMFDDTDMGATSQMPEWKKLEQILRNNGIEEKFIKGFADGGFAYMSRYLALKAGAKTSSSWEGSEKLNAMLREAGFDGIKGELNDAYQYTIFTPNQAKLTTNEVPSTFFDTRYSTQETDIDSNRAMLANAFEGLSQNSEEYKMIQEYKGRIKILNEYEDRLAKVNAEIYDMTFGKDGERDSKKLQKLRAEAKELSEHISRNDKKLLSMEASEPLRKVIEQERKKASQKTKEHIKQIVQNKKARAEQTEVRHKIRKTVRDLDKILNRGNKKQNVKEDMKDFVSQALELADYLFTDHISNDELIRKGITVRMTAREEALVRETEDILSKLYDNADSLTDEEFTRLDAKRKANEDKLRDLLTAQRNERLNTPVAKLFDDLVKAYASLKNSNQDAVKAAYSEELENSLRAFMGDGERAKILQNMRVADMTTEELNWLYRAYTMVLTNVRNANKLFVQGKQVSIEQTVSAIVMDFAKRKAPDGKAAIVARNIANKIGWDYEKLYYALDRIGSEAFTELIMNLANSENIVMQDVMEAAAYRDQIVENYGFNNWDVNKKIDKVFLDNTGKKFQLTLGQLMSLYAYSRREGAWDHIEYGGFVFGEKALTDPRPADSYKLSQAQCEAITSTLTKEQKGYVEDMQKFLSETMGAKGNEVSMMLYGIKMFGEKNYFPIHIAGQYKAQANEAQAKAAAGFSSMTNAGFTHEQNPNAKAPFVLEGFNEIWVDHVNEMSRYHGAVPAMEDIRRVMNRSSYSDAYAESMSVTAMMENAFGQEAVEYFNNLYREANSGAIQDKLQKWPKKLLSLFRKNSVAYSLSVLIQQPASLVRAYSMIDKKYFGFKGFGTITSGAAKAVSSKWNKAYTNAYNEMLKYAPGVTMAKEIGGFDTATGGSIRSYLLDTGKSLKQKMKTENALGKGKAVLDVVDNNAIANLPNVADKIAWIEIWNACKREIVAKHKDLATNSDEFMQIVGDRFTEVIRATQVYDSIFAKSPMLKSKNLAVQYMVSFMNEPNTVANMAEKAVRDVTKGNWKKGARTAAVVVHSIIFTNVLKSIIYAMRDDDEDETYIEKYIEAITGGMMDDFWPANYIPLVRDAWSIAQGYDVERADMAIVADAIDAFGKVFKNATTDTDDMTEEQLIEFDKKCTEANWKLAESLASFIGIPVKNIRREVDGIIDHARIASANAGMTTASSLWDKVTESVLGSIPGMSSKETKTDKLYEAIISGDKTYLDRLKGTYKTDDAYHTAVRKALKENDPRIKEAAQARYDGNTEEYKRIFREIQSEGNIAFDDIMAAVNSELSKLTPDKVTSDYTASGYVETVILGNTIDAEAMKDNIISAKVANGKTQEEAEKEFATNVATGIHDAYSSGLLDDAEAEKMLLEYAGKDEDEAASKVSYWGFCEEYPQYKDVFTESHLAKYREFGEPAEISVDEYAQYISGTKGLETIYDDWGDVEVSKRDQVLEVIDSLPLTRKQKDALYLAAGYSENKIWDVPW